MEEQNHLPMEPETLNRPDSAGEIPTASQPTASAAPTPAPQPTASAAPTPAPQPTVSEQPAPAPQPTVSAAPTPAPQPTASEQPAPAPQPTASTAPAPAPLPTMLSATPPYHGFAIASLVLGIASWALSLLCLFCCGGLLALPAAITGLVLGAVARHKGNEEDVSLVGIVLCGQSIVYIVVSSVLMGLFMWTVPELLNELAGEWQSAPPDWDMNNMLAFFRR